MISIAPLTGEITYADAGSVMLSIADPHSAATYILDSDFIVANGRYPTFAEIANLGPSMLTPSALGIVANSLFATPEAHANFVTSLYQGILGRASDAPGFQGWVQALDTQAMGEWQVAQAFVHSAEGRVHLAGGASLNHDIYANPSAPELGILLEHAATVIGVNFAAGHIDASL